MARLYSDEDFPYPTVHELRRLGHDVLTVQQASQAGRGVDDIDVLAHAQTLGRTVITINRKDFIRIHRQQPNHFGIIVCRSDLDFVDLARRIHVAIEATPDLSGQLLRVNRRPT